ncbi:MAG: toll/interleukin-1 receptor domain-containing protein [Bacteroidota bacterium]
MKVFISHSSTDKRFVRTLKDDLNENNIETWFDEDELDIGDSLADKLEIALDQSSHFLIILSPTSINSEWVNFEIQKAIKNKTNKSIQKILPVKYKECDIPNELSLLLYADLSKETRHINGEKIVFIGTEYLTFLSKICKAIKSSDKKLSITDKIELKKEFVIDTQKYEQLIEPKLIKASYLVIGYQGNDSRNNYATSVLKRTKDKSLLIEKIRPILLPPLLKNIFKGIDYGDKIYFSKNYLFNEIGHFAGFRKNDLGIVIDGRIRNGIGISAKRTYNIDINIEEKRFTFLD